MCNNARWSEFSASYYDFSRDSDSGSENEVLIDARVRVVVKDGVIGLVCF